MVYYLLMEFDGPMIRQFRSVAGFQSLKAGAHMVLENLSESIRLKEKIEMEDGNDSHSANKLDRLIALQEYFTSDLEQLFFDIALELTITLQDVGQTWQWIQRRKARGLARILRDSLPAEKLNSAPDYISLQNPLAFEDLQWAQTTTATRLVFVDWITFGTCPSKLLFFSFSMDQDGDGPYAVRKMIQLDTPLEDLIDATGRIDEARMTDSDAERYLRPFIPVVQPLEDFFQKQSWSIS